MALMVLDFGWVINLTPGQPYSVLKSNHGDSCVTEWPEPLLLAVVFGHKRVGRLARPMSAHSAKCMRLQAALHSRPAALRNVGCLGLLALPHCAVEELR